MSVTTRLASITASAALTFTAFGVVAAYADDSSTTDPCAQQQVQVDKAQSALERVTAVFARQQERVDAAREADDEADDEAAAGPEKAAAQRALKEAKQAKAETKATKRAQQQRLAKATERLTTCQTEQATPEAPVAS